MMVSAECLILPKFILEVLFFQRSSSFLMIKVLKLYKHSIDGGSNCSKLLFSSLRALHIDGALYFPCFILKLLLQNCRIEKK